jgi:hypothetical protein
MDVFLLIVVVAVVACLALLGVLITLLLPMVKMALLATGIFILGVAVWWTIERRRGRQGPWDSRR